MKRPFNIPKAGTHCALCLQQAVLKHSHIIPESCYKPIYGDKHRMITFDPKDVDQHYFEQKGLRSYLLCGKCEQYLNDNFEKPFHKSWHETNIVDHFPANAKIADTTVDYVAFKLFHLSVLWRASVSDHPGFSKVSLGPHAEAIRRMLLNMDPGEPWQYPIVCGVLTSDAGQGDTRQIVATPQPLKYHGHRAYLFTFSGCYWLYFVGSHQVQEIDHLRLRPDGVLPAGPYSLTRMIQNTMRNAYRH